MTGCDADCEQSHHIRSSVLLKCLSALMLPRIGVPVEHVAGVYFVLDVSLYSVIIDDVHFSAIAKW